MGGLEGCDFLIEMSSSYLNHVESLYRTMQALECQFTTAPPSPSVEGARTLL